MTNIPSQNQSSILIYSLKQNNQAVSRSTYHLESQGKLLAKDIQTTQNDSRKGGVEEPAKPRLLNDIYEEYFKDIRRNYGYQDGRMTI
jgi:hypothetical protein